MNPLRTLRETFIYLGDGAREIVQKFCRKKKEDQIKILPTRYIESDLVKSFEKFVAKKKAESNE